MIGHFGPSDGQVGVATVEVFSKRETAQRILNHARLDLPAELK